MQPELAFPRLQEGMRLGPAARRVGRRLTWMGVCALLLGMAWAWWTARPLLPAYLVAYVFFLSITLGSLFLVATLHVTRAGWGVTSRRIVEVLAGNLPVLAILFLPILAPMLLGDGRLYGWVDPAADHGADHGASMGEKAAYLNVPFFTLRALGYFLIWGFLGRLFLRQSVEQDASSDPRITQRLESTSAPALVILAVTVTFASFDWLMSLDPHWTSTIFGIYFFSGAMVAALAAVILAAMGLQATGRLRQCISIEHYHDLGKLLLAMVIFWGYIAFSQYMLIWYANIPEETAWYRVRLTGFWGWMALALLLGHLLIPFFGLLSRWVKRSKGLLAFWATWMLAAHAIDLQWLVMPSLAGDAGASVFAGMCIWIGVGCLYLAGVLRIAAEIPLVPQADPRLAESLAFENF